MSDDKLGSIKNMGSINLQNSAQAQSELTKKMGSQNRLGSSNTGLHKRTNSGPQEKDISSLRLEGGDIQNLECGHAHTELDCGHAESDLECSHLYTDLESNRHLYESESCNYLEGGMEESMRGSNINIIQDAGNNLNLLAKDSQFK